MNTNITLHKILGHLRTILIHKWWVFYYSYFLGIPWRGIKHDLSKFSPTEFWESVRYWDGTSSPIPRCKEDKGYSLAWQHHKGRNPHHYEYWIDYLDQGGKPIKMPWKDVLEMTADWLGAGKAYQKDNFTLQDEYTWVLKKLEVAKIHPKTKQLLEQFFGSFSANPKYLREFKKRLMSWKYVYENMDFQD